MRDQLLGELVKPEFPLKYLLDNVSGPSEILGNSVWGGEKKSVKKLAKAIAET
jgi:hypothetical protein